MDLLFKNVRIDEAGALKDVAVKDGKIVAIEDHVDGDVKRTIEGNGRVLVPGLVESHIHLDKALIANRKPNLSGTLKEAIEVTASLKPTFSAEDIYERATKALKELILPNGVTFMRTHAEFDPSQGFTGFDVIMKIKEEFKDYIDIQVVAFPQEGIFKAPGTEEMMVEAMERGADVVGAVPYNDRDAIEHIDYVFELAQRFNKPIDLHQDFADNADKISIDYLAKKTIETGYQGRVSVGHLTAIAALPPEELQPILELMAEADISVMALPATDLHLGARNDTYNVRRTVTPIRKLRDAGVNVCIATNNIRNAFTPYGTGDIVQTAMLAIPVAHLGGAADLPTVLPMITTNPARALGLDGYGIVVGNNADMVLLDTTSYGDAIIDLPIKSVVVKSGRVTVENSKTTQFGIQ
ncbi:amidohydrolase family protein [Erysipelothrix sp. HDW6C]|uniref:amidohydrolase family protein n=1 Tax=Erysipelothrix sp. HDW6C TaxID=2714930 RepID=UPI00140A2446|nr:amidohydrolase family protein [Erysipelothrix sp. HDW6C]QIK69400.1 amidohydrolase family protein [Erysipelothrix sp. HDW6C]